MREPTFTYYNILKNCIVVKTCEIIKEKHRYEKCLKNREIITKMKIFLSNNNKSVDTKFPDDSTAFLTANKVELKETEEGGSQFAVEMLIMLTSGSPLLDRRISLKPGQPALLIYSLCTCRGHVNGAKLLLRAFQPSLFMSESLTGDQICKFLSPRKYLAALVTEPFPSRISWELSLPCESVLSSKEINPNNPCF